MRIGKYTYQLDSKVYIPYVSSICGTFEANGNLRTFVDNVMQDDLWGCKTHEMAEIKMQKHIISQCLERANINDKALDCIIGGDLINQIVPTSFSAREFETPFLGLYNACSTFGEALIVGSCMLNNDMNKVICVTSSHYATAERQYRFPLELGTQPTPSSQWTVTGAGCVLLDKNPSNCPYITRYVIGRIVDLQCSDANNMGAVMAPAAFDTIYKYFDDTSENPDDFDMILTGDLGRFGMDTLHYLLSRSNISASNLNDCGCLIYSKEQNAVQGGSGAGCSSLVFCEYIYKLFEQNDLQRILFVPTGALLSKDSPLQGSSIPAIAHAVVIEKCHKACQ